MTAIGRALMGSPACSCSTSRRWASRRWSSRTSSRRLRASTGARASTLLVAEQNAAIALRYAHRACVLENGTHHPGGPAAELSSREDVRELYFGLAHDAEGGFRTQACSGPAELAPLTATAPTAQARSSA